MNAGKLLSLDGAAATTAQLRVGEHLPSMNRRWEPGASVLLRQFFRRRIWNATPATVVEDDEWIALWLPPGVRGKRGEGDLFGEWELVDVCWRSHRHGILRVTRPGEAHSTLFFWNDDGSFRGWYLNLERPLVRTSLGFDFEDRLLDVWIGRDGDTRWLDMDELARARALGLITASDAEAIVREGERGLDDYRHGRPPFAAGWEQWQPDPAWPKPSLPRHWDALPASDGGRDAAR